MTKFDGEVHKAAAKAAAQYHVPIAAVLAVIEVESAGKIYAKVGGRNEPLIRFEGHYFYKRVVKMNLAKAQSQGLASKTAGVVKNPSSQAARWAMIERAAKLDRQAAYESTSWGIGQVMGAHWKLLGYKSVLDLVETARRGVDGQLELMMRYIVKTGLDAAMNRLDWKRFALGYNGPGAIKAGYDRKLAEAFTRWHRTVLVEEPRLPDPAEVPIPAERPLSPEVSACLDDVAAENRFSKTELGAGAIAVSSGAQAVKETVDAVNDTGSTLLSLGPWILLALVCIGFAGFIYWDRRKKKLAARAAKAVA